MSGMINRARAFSTEALKVVNNVAKQQFIITLRGDDAILSYDKSGNKIIFMHTEVPKKFQGKGVGKLLAEYAFNHALENKLDVICRCHFLAKYYENNINNYKSLKIKFELNK